MRPLAQETLQKIGAMVGLSATSRCTSSVVRDTRDYERLLSEKLYGIPGMRHSKSSFVLRVLKASVPLG